MRSGEAFLPECGAQWDAPGKTDSGKTILLEATSHLEEIVSPGTEATRASRRKIIASLEETKKHLKVDHAQAIVTFSIVQVLTLQT